MKKEKNNKIEFDEENKEKQSVIEKISDGIEDTLDTIDEAFHPGDFQSDIPATHKTDSGRRIISKSQTNKNINKRLFGENWHKPALIIFLILLVIGGIVALVEFLV